MSDRGQSREPRVSELARLRQRIAHLEASQSDPHAEAALLRAALMATVNAVVITNREGVIEWVNPAFSSLTGYTLAEAVGRNPGALVKSGEHDAVFYRRLWDTILAGHVWHGDTVNRRKDGSLYTEAQSITPVRDAHGEISHFVAVKQDITTRAAAEAEGRARAQITALRAAIGLALTRGHSLSQALQECTEALVTHLGAAVARIWTLNDGDEALELQASAGPHTHTAGRHQRIPPGTLVIGRIARDRTPHITNDVLGDPEVHDQEWAQQEGMVAFAGYPLLVDGRVNGVVALFAQHTLPDAVMTTLASVADHLALGIDRHRSLDLLQESEARMRFALDNAHVGIWDMDYPTGVLRWSATLEAQYGLRPGTFDGTFDAFVERIHPSDRAAVLDTIGKATTSGAHYTVEHRAIWPDGTLRWLTGAGRIQLDKHGRPARGIGISLDVTERHTLEAQFLQAQKMEAVGRLAGGVAHDFNNLLTVMLGYCELSLPDFPPGDRHRADLEQIEKAAMRAAGLTRQLLAFSRQQVIQPTLLELNVVVHDMRAMLGRLIGEDVAIVLRLEPDAGSVKADRGQLEQVVMNLAVNARDAMPQGGTLTIATAQVELDEDYAAMHLGVIPGAYVALRVTDTGTGMTSDVQAHLFEPFFTTKGIGKGTGLGLSTVYGIAKQSGGSVGVYSEVGQGTSFHVYFPRVQETALAPEAKPLVARRPAHDETVLVVEDEDGLRELTRRLLERQGYTVLVATNADDALRLCDQHMTVDLLLTDVVMPGKSGPELTRQLAERRPGLKVLYMSGYTEDAIIHHGVHEPGIAFLQKPFTSATLGRKIREVLDR